MAERNEWTFGTLLHHMEALMSERDLRYAQLAEANQKAIQAALAAAEKAVAVAETNSEKWRTNANEWREAMNDRERNFLSKGMGYVVGALSIAAMFVTIFKAIV